MVSTPDHGTHERGTAGSARLPSSLESDHHVGSEGEIVYSDAQRRASDNTRLVHARIWADIAAMPDSTPAFIDHCATERPVGDGAEEAGASTDGNEFDGDA